MICLGIDFGTTSWGFGAGDTITMTTQALCAVKADQGSPSWQEIDRLVSQWMPETIVLGYPLKADGSRFKLTDLVDRAAQELRQRYPKIAVVLADERLTTVEARDNLFTDKGFKGLEKGRIDAESARLILHHWFEASQI
ncbi:Holliday junction resolvase RuvX [Candidatus Synchoanobacter obligatus]|uniref:Putative pre-16S rRNA nuclease n=1 Tax=Candidatus Synchoanobacter obligatus TaxID=2919597 RepID=A0ABT1L4Y5_9GAMM|nr:Holliday junction resolvase RuvX [Candidatus Synchoanobacter obligatus]